MREVSAFTTEAAWRASVAVVASAYEISPRILGARHLGGRRASVPKDCFEARKVALYVTLLTVDCGYSGLARKLGLHKATTALQIGEMRDRAAADPMFARRTLLLEERARARLVTELMTVLDEADAAIVQAYERMGACEASEDVRRRLSIKAKVLAFTTQGSVERPTPESLHRNFIEVLPGGRE